MVLEVVHRHEKLASESGSNLWRRFLEPVSEACVSLKEDLRDSSDTV